MLVKNWREMWRSWSFQISVILIILETLNTISDSLPEQYAMYVRPALLVALPVVRLMKQTKLGAS